MDTMTAYTTLRACFGEAWGAGVYCEGDELLVFGRVILDILVRDRLLSAALVACRERNFDVFVPADEPYRVGVGEFGERFFLGYGPDPLSRLCAALAKMKEARDGTA